jgi:hypothetical protein
MPNALIVNSLVIEDRRSRTLRQRHHTLCLLDEVVYYCASPCPIYVFQNQTSNV